MRLNWFLPLRGQSETGSTGGPGRVRRGLERIGPTWGASPLRRSIQAICFLVFLWLFCYVCWPYTARPARVWKDWWPIQVDEQAGTVLVESQQPPIEAIYRQMVLYVVDQSNPQQQDLIPLRVTGVGQKELHLEPLHAEQIHELSMSLGLWSLHEAPPGSWPSHYADDLQAKEWPAAESLLALDPLVSLSTALAARCWVWSLGWAGVMLAICLVVPRGFCGYVCPLGTLIDLFDWAVGKRVRRLQVAADGWWTRLKYCLLAAVLIASWFGVLISGFVAAIPLLTRGMAFLLTPLQTGAERGWHQVLPVGAGHYLSIGLFLGVLGLGLLRPRFWCKYICPSGAVFSLGNLFRLTERQVESSCVGCGKCVEICPFDAIEPDFTTRTGDCTFCQSCGGVCPVRAIRFVPRWSRAEPKPAGDAPSGGPPSGETAIGRRGFLGTAVGVAAGGLGGIAAAAAVRASGADPAMPLPVRPPGSVPENEFLQLCIRCGECFQACPNDVLQPQGFRQGLTGLWTPEVVADWSGCEPSCNNCGQVCPTGAIRAVPLEEKRVARMGLAVLDERTCLPYAGREPCQLCVDECVTAGSEAIEFVRVGTDMDAAGDPIEGTGLLAPVVVAHKCVGCGLCQTRCRAINAAAKGLLKETAIRVESGEAKEDRLTHGRYTTLRENEARKRQEELRKQLPQSEGEDGYLLDFLK